MADSDFKNKRIELDTILRTALGSNNVYFQPPESLKLSYPCIIYTRSEIKNTHADNLAYCQGHAYKVTHITSDPDDDTIDTLSKLPFAKFERAYTYDNLNHYVYNIYYK